MQQKGLTIGTDGWGTRRWMSGHPVSECSHEEGGENSAFSGRVLEHASQSWGLTLSHMQGCVL